MSKDNYYFNWKSVVLDILKILSGALAGYFGAGCCTIVA